MEPRTLGDTSTHAPFQQIKIAPKNFVPSSQQNEGGAKIANTMSPTTPQSVSQMMHSLGAPQPSSLGSINQEDPLSPVDAMSILAEVASKETEEEVREVIAPYTPKSIPQAQNAGMHALHAVASYGQNMAPHFIIQAKASMPKEHSSKNSKKAKFDAKCYHGYLEQMLMMTRPVNLPCIETGPVNGRVVS